MFRKRLFLPYASKPPPESEYLSTQQCSVVMIVVLASMIDPLIPRVCPNQPYAILDLSDSFYRYADNRPECPHPNTQYINCLSKAETLRQWRKVVLVPNFLSDAGCKPIIPI